MKQMFKFFVATAAITAGFASCSSEEVIPSGTDTLDRSNLTIVLNNSGAATKAVVDANAVPAETEIKSIHLFIFGSATEAEKDTIFRDGVGGNPFTVGTVDNTYKATYYSAPVGSKYIYVGVNLSDDLHKAIKEQGVSKEQIWSTLTKLQELSPASGGFPMFNDRANAAPYQLKKGTTTQVDASVKRLVAKVTVETAQVFEDNSSNERTANGMTIDSDLEFALGQLNTKVYPYPQVGDVDPNYDGSSTYLTTDFINEHFDFKGTPSWTIGTSNVFDNFKAVTNATDAGSSNMTKFIAGYAPENTHAIKRTGEMTYAAIKAKFKPEYIHSYDGNITATKYTNESLAKLYVFNNGGQFLYFINKADADLYVTDSNLGYETYTDGYCFYTVYLNTNTTSNSGNVLRNEYYKLAIQKIAKIGKPYPGPSDPEEELDAKADIEVKITVQPWSQIPQNVVLGD
jgi:hypothetical protein